MPPTSTRVAPWEDFVLRLIAIYKLGKALLFFVVALGVRQLLHHDVSQFLNDYVIEYHVDPENRLLNRLLNWGLSHASNLTDHRIRFISYILFFYAAIFALEGVGLYLRKHWAEYMVLISTGSLLPIEFYEIYHKLAWWKFGVLLGNLLIIVYLVHRLILDAQFKKLRREEDARLERDEMQPTAPDLNGKESVSSRHVTTKVP